MVLAHRELSGCVNSSNPYHRCADFCLKGVEGVEMRKGVKYSGNHGVTKQSGGDSNLLKERRVHPQCVNRLNPFHVCAEHCFERIAKSNPHAVRGKTGGIEEERAVNKVAVKDRKVHPDCVNASNPYHVCAAYCFEKMGISLAQLDRKDQVSDPVFIDSFNQLSKRKKEGSLMQVLDGVSVLIKVRSGDATPPSSLPSPNKKEEAKNVELGFSQKYDTEMPNNDSSSDGGKVETIESLPASGKLSKVMQGGSVIDVPVTSFDGAKSISSVKSAKQENGLGAIASSPRMGSISSNISDLTVAFENGDDEEDVGSTFSDSRVLVGKYYVKESNSSVLQSIFEQHGDIAENSALESTLLQSYYLDCVCSVVGELQSTPFMLLTKSRAKELSAILNDVESSHMNVAWLRHRLNEITEAMELLSDHRSVKAAKVKCDVSLEAAKKELDSEVEGLALKVKELEDAKARVVEIKQRLSDLEIESSQLNESYSSIRSKVEKLQLKPMSDAGM